MFPRERFCADCGGLLESAPEEDLLPERASSWAVLGSLVLDSLVVGLTVLAQLGGLMGGATLGLAVVAILIYRLGGRSGGRQTFGQAVFGLLTVDLAGQPAAWMGSGRRTILEWWWLPWGLLRGQAAWERLERQGGTREVRFA